VFARIEEVLAAYASAPRVEPPHNVVEAQTRFK